MYLAKQQFNNYEEQLDIARKTSPVKLTRVFSTKKNRSVMANCFRSPDFDVVQWLVKGITKNAFTDGNALIGPEGNDKKRTMLSQIDTGEVITSMKVTGLGEDAGVAANLEKACVPLLFALTYPPACPAFCVRATKWMSTGPAA